MSFLTETYNLRSGRFARHFIGCLALLVAVACGRSERRTDVGPAGSGGDVTNAGNAGEEGGTAGTMSTGGSPGHAGNGGDPAGGGEAGDTFGAGAGGEFGEQECSLEPVTSGAEYTWDVAVVMLELELTLNGAQIPDSPNGQSRGVVSATNRTTGSVQAIPISASGSGRASAPIFAGRYDLTFDLSESDVIAGIEPPASKRLATDLTITEAQTLKFDLETITLTGTVTVNGERMADSSVPESRGSLGFRDPVSGDHIYVEVGPTGDATFETVLFAGRYDVLFQCSNQTVEGLPYAAATRVATDALFERDEDLRYDLQPVEVNVALTSNGAPLPDSDDAYRGMLSFRDWATNTTYRFDIGASGATSFSARVFAGDYDVTLTTGGEIPAPFPSAGLTRLTRAVAITGGEFLSYDVKPVTVSGSVSMNGGALPDHPNGLSRGSVSFRDASTGNVYDLDVGASGDALYSGHVFAGEYDVSFKSNLVPPPGMPVGGVSRLESRVTIGEDRLHDYALAVVRMDGSVTSHGGALPDSPGALTRGHVSFRDSLTSAVQEFDLGATGPAVFSALLFAGSYDTTFETATDALAGLPSGAATRVAGHVAIANDQTVAYDVRPIEFGGRVSVNGDSMPDSPLATKRGAVVFRDKFTNVAHPFELGATGEATFSAFVFDGVYDAALQTSDQELAGLPVAATTLIATGCLDRGFFCAGSSDDLGDYWTFVFDVAGWGPLAIDLEDDGNGTLSGPFVTPTDSGTFLGSRDGNSFTLTAELGTSGCSPLTLHATLFDACGVSGYATCGGFPRYNPHFTGFR